MYLPKDLSAVWLRQHPPRAVLRREPPLARRTCCGLCHTSVDPDSDDEAEAAVGGALPAYDYLDTTLRVCGTCSGFRDAAVPLQAPAGAGEHFLAGWDLRAMPDEGSGDAT